jgi:hypothetical protein
MSRQGTAFRIALVGCLLAASDAANATESLINSQSPYWETGPRDNKLSNACSINRFNERDVGHYVVRLHDKKGGAAVLGVAKGNGFNLWDPDKLAVANEDYMFRQDGTSACEVFVGGRKALLPGQTPPKPGAPGSPATPQPVPQTPGSQTPGSQPPGTPPPTTPPPPQPTVPGASPTNGPPT